MFNQNKRGFGINFGGQKQSNVHKAKNLPPTKKVEYEGEPGYENDRNEELSAVAVAFKEGAKKENERRDDYTDNEFYASIVFTNKAQRNAFFAALGVECTDKTDFRFVNGVQLAKIMNIDLPTGSALPPAKFKQSKAVMELTFLPKPKQKKK
jgi:hypothetical protein